MKKVIDKQKIRDLHDQGMGTMAISRKMGISQSYVSFCLLSKERQMEQRIKKHELEFGGNREKAIQRDHEQCVQCGMTREEHRKRFKKDISVHHINGKGTSYAKEEKDNRLENLQTLCLECHGWEDVMHSTTPPIPVIGTFITTGEKVFFPSTTTASRKLGGLSGRPISLCIDGRCKRAFGYTWERATLPPSEEQQ